MDGEGMSSITLRIWKCLTCGGAAGLIALAGASPATSADAGHTLVVKDSTSLHLASADGNTLIEQGKATGTLPGSVRVTLVLKSHTATSSFTIYASGGSISGSGSGGLKVGTGGWDSFGGKLTVQHGSGRYGGAHGIGDLYGSVYRVTDAMKAQVTGTLHY